MENNLIRLLDSQHLDEVTSEICDFTLEEQNQFAESQGIKPSASSDHVPVLGNERLTVKWFCIENYDFKGKTVTYIVAVVLFNEAGDLLLIQEAKKSCAGKWWVNDIFWLA